jgi:hypothetical protein
MNKINWKDPKVKYGAAGAAAIVAFALYKSKLSGGSSPSSTIGNPSGAASALGDANLQSAVYDSLEQQYQGLNARLSKTQKTVSVIAHRPASPKPPVKPKPPATKKVPIAKATPIVKPPTVNPGATLIKNWGK